MKTIAFTFLICFCLFLGTSKAQDTFSMIAFDPTTGEIGAAGATCVSFFPLGGFINRIVPGVGVVTAQASVSTFNRDYATSLIQQGIPADDVIDSLYLNDSQNTPEIRQNIVLTHQGGVATTAGFTGTQCMNYANHIIGPNYVIAGNILLGQNILDSMESRFLTTQGSLAEKLMAALQGAKVIGADSRCTPYNTSSLSAYLRVALPTDSIEHYSCDLNVAANPNAPFEPIDSLQALFDSLKISTGIPDPRTRNFPLPFTVLPDPVSSVISFPRRIQGPVLVHLFDVTGRRVLTAYRIEENTLDISGLSLEPSIYFIQVFDLEENVIGNGKMWIRP